MWLFSQLHWTSHNIHRTADIAVKDPLPRGEDKFVPVNILKERKRPPGFLFRRAVELHASSRQLLICSFDIVAGQRAVEERTDAAFVHGEQDKPRV